VDQSGGPWNLRDVAERKVLVNAMEEGQIWELIPESYVITERGRQQDYPSLSLEDARTLLERFAREGLIGIYRLGEEAEFLEEAAVSLVANDEIWTMQGNGGLCMFLTEAGEREVGLTEPPLP